MPDAGALLLGAEGGGVHDSTRIGSTVLSDPDALRFITVVSIYMQQLTRRYL